MKKIYSIALLLSMGFYISLSGSSDQGDQSTHKHTPFEEYDGASSDDEKGPFADLDLNSNALRKHLKEQPSALRISREDFLEVLPSEPSQGDEKLTFEPSQGDEKNEIELNQQRAAAALIEHLNELQLASRKSASDCFINDLVHNAHCIQDSADTVFDLFLENNLSEYDYSDDQKIEIITYLFSRPFFNNFIKLPNIDISLRNKALSCIRKILTSKKCITFEVLQCANRQEIYLIYSLIAFWLDPQLLSPLEILEFLNRIQSSIGDDQDKKKAFIRILNAGSPGLKITPIHSLIMHGIQSKNNTTRRMRVSDDVVILDGFKQLLKFFLDHDVRLLTQLAHGNLHARSFLHACTCSDIVDMELFEIILQKMKKQVCPSDSFESWVNRFDENWFTPIHTVVHELLLNQLPEFTSSCKRQNSCSERQISALRDKIFLSKNKILKLLEEETINLFLRTSFDKSVVDSAWTSIQRDHSNLNLWQSEKEYEALKIKVDVFCALLNTQQKKISDLEKKNHNIDLNHLRAGIEPYAHQGMWKYVKVQSGQFVSNIPSV